jgi:hypothetical protein
MNVLGRMEGFERSEVKRDTLRRKTREIGRGREQGGNNNNK